MQTVPIQSSKNILLCLRYGIGDLVMELPAIRALRAALPAASITALGAHPALQLLEGDPAVDRLVNVHHFGFLHWGDFGSPELLSRIHEWLEREGFDTIIDPSHAVLGMGEALWTYHSHLFDAGGPLQEEALQLGMGGGQAILEAVRQGWGIEIPDDAVPRLHSTAEEMEEADSVLSNVGAQGKKLIGIAPVASSPLKQWPLENFARILRSLGQRENLSILLFQGPQVGEARELMEQVGECPFIHPVGAIPLRKVAALLTRCSVFIGHDTGLMHMAAAVGTSLVALFGPTSPEIYLPTQVSSLALGGDRPCGYRKRTSFGPPACVMEGRCLDGERSCIDRVEVEDLRKALDDCLRCPGSLPSPQGPEGMGRLHGFRKEENLTKGAEVMAYARDGEFHA